MGRQSKYPPEVRERAVRLVFEQLGSRLGVVGHIVDRREDGLYAGDAAEVSAAVTARRRQAAWADHQRA